MTTEEDLPPRKPPGLRRRLLRQLRRPLRKVRSLLRDTGRVFYPQHWPAMRKSGVPFLKDTQPGALSSLVDSLKARGTDTCVILGNGPSLGAIDDSLMEEFRARNWLTIGLNRSIYRFATDVLIWSDLETLESILGPESRLLSAPHRESMVVVQAVLPVGKSWHEQIERWAEQRTLDVFGGNKLFMFRTVLSSALHLSRLTGVRRIILSGVDLDNRTYFYKTDKYQGTEAYELRGDTSLEGHFHGYSTHRIVEELLAFCTSQGIDVSYVGSSSFLATLPGLTRLDPSAPDFRDQLLR